jgi:predicted outer membrane repeat protein
MANSMALRCFDTTRGMQGMIDRIATFVEALWRARRGSVAIQIGLMLTIIVGMSALGTEITFLMYKHRQMQSAADSAALGAATALATGHPSDPVLEARAIAASLGFVDGVDSTTVTVNRPPLTGVHTADATAVEVVVSQPQLLTMVGLFREGLFAVGVHAVAVLGGTGNFCVLELNTGTATGVSMSNGAVVNLTQCGMAVDSTGSAALSVTGGAILNTKSLSVSGNTSVNNGGVINATDGVKTYQPAVADPYAGVARPSFSGCNYNNKSLGHSASTQYLSPGVYCNGLAFTNDAIVVMNPGVYFIDRGTFNVGGAVRLTGTGVTIVLTKSTGSNYATVTIGNGANVTLSAPTSGATAGLVFFGDRNAPLSKTSSFTGGATVSITGAIYLPTQTVTFSNGISNPSGCTQLIAGKIQFTGGANFKNNCTNTGVSAIGATSTTLVE